MPSRGLRLCSRCRVALIKVGTGGLCPSCRAQKDQEDKEAKRERQREYNATRRPEDRFYGTQRWRKMRDSFLRDNPVCQMCEPYVPATVAHHIKERKDGGEDSRDNLMALCHRCHEEIHGRRGFANGRYE